MGGGHELGKLFHPDTGLHQVSRMDLKRRGGGLLGVTRQNWVYNLDIVNLKLMPGSPLQQEFLTRTLESFVNIFLKMPSPPFPGHIYIPQI